MNETSSASILQKIIGDEMMQEVCTALGGIKVYVPSKPLPDGRDADIRNEFSELADHPKMQAYKIIAQKHNLSESRVRQVVRV